MKSVHTPFLSYQKEKRKVPNNKYMQYREMCIMGTCVWLWGRQLPFWDCRVAPANTGPQSQLLLLSEERFGFSCDFGTLDRTQIYIGSDDLDYFYPSYIFLDGLFVSGIFIGAYELPGCDCDKGLILFWYSVLLPLKYTYLLLLYLNLIIGNCTSRMSRLYIVG